MKRPLPITSPDNPRIKQLVHLRKHRERRELRLFVLEGRRELSRALQAGLIIKEIFLCPEIAGLDFPAFQKHGPPLPPSAALFVITPSLLAKVSLLENPEGLLAVAVPPAWSWEQLPPPGSADLFLVAAGINKPGNLGAMARTAAAVNATALIADAEIDPWNPNAIRASTGAVFSLPILIGTTDELVRMLRHRGCRIMVATPEASLLYTETDLTRPLAMVIGAEDQGVPDAWRAASTDQLALPMAKGIVDSLNASNTAAILLFETLRQRTAGRNK